MIQREDTNMNSLPSKGTSVEWFSTLRNCLRNGQFVSLAAGARSEQPDPFVKVRTNTDDVILALSALTECKG